MSVILNPYRYAGAGGPTFGNASREFNADHIVIDYPLASTDPCSLAFWLKLSSTAGLTRGVISISGSPTDTSPMILLQTEPRYVFGTGGFKFPSIIKDIWQHVTITYNGSSSWEWFLNSSSEGTATHANNPDTDFIYIGHGYAFELNGGSRIADVRLYDSVISSGDISSIYSGTHVSSGLIGWWLTDNDDVLDYSGNGNDGTNNGSTYSTDGPFD